MKLKQQHRKYLRKVQLQRHLRYLEVPFQGILDLRLFDQNYSLGYILDCSFGQTISDPKSLEMELLSIAGVVEVGLFVDICDAVVLASHNGVMTLINDSGSLN